MNITKKLDNYNIQISKIFGIIKIKNWNLLKKIIQNNDDDFDYNIKDLTNVYLIEYLVLHNQIDIIQILLTKNIRIDIMDDNGQTLLYNIIKFSYIDILKLFINKNNKLIGKNILDLIDKNGDIPLFYAIKKNNIECIKIILEHTTNFTTKNFDGETAIQLSIEHNELDIFKIIIDKYKNINLCNSNGENILQLIIKNNKLDMFEHVMLKYANDINMNHTENIYNYSVLHYLFIHKKFEFIELFFKHIEKNNIDIDVNLQDTSGNTFYHYYLYYINVDALKIYNIIKKYQINYNLFNIDGDTPCHIIINYIDKFSKYLQIVENTIMNTNINIPNNKGNSVLFLLVKENKWEEYENILINKKLNIFIINFKNHTMFEYIVDIDKFINLVTKSYLKQLVINVPKDGWIHKWDAICSNSFNNTNTDTNINTNTDTNTDTNTNTNTDTNINTNTDTNTNTIIELTNDEQKEINKNNKKFKDNKYYNDNNSNNNNNICYKIIYAKLYGFSVDFIKTKNIYKKYSYPSNLDIIKLIPTYLNVITSTYTGSTIDIFCGLVYLKNKFMSKNVLIKTSLELIDTNNSIINCNIGLNDKKICEITGFEIIWKNNNLYIPSSKRNNLHNLIVDMKFNKIRYLIVPIGIEMYVNNSIFNHANILIFDTEMNEVERFEPHGANSPFKINTDVFDNAIKDNLRFLKFTYKSPKDYLPLIGFQKKEIYELDKDYIADPNGFCSTWCIFYADMRISYPQYTREKLYKLLNKEIINEQLSYKQLIRNYGYYVTNLRDALFKKINININDWINDNIDKYKTIELNDLLIKEL